MKNTYILLVIILLASCGSNDNKSIEEKQPLNIIIAIDFDCSRLKDEKLIAYDTAIIDYVLDYFTSIQRSKRFDSKDRIIFVPVSFNTVTNSNTFVLDADKLRNLRTGGNPGLQKKISNIKEDIRSTYKKNQSENVSSDFYRFFKDELTHYIKNNYSNKLIILSNGTSIIKEETMTTNYNNKTFIYKEEYEKVLNDKNWEFSRLAQNIELSPVSVSNFQNLDVLMLALKSDDYNENALLKTIWGSWLSKLGFNHSILPFLSDVSSYRERIEDFLSQTSIIEDKITVKNRTNKYVEYIGLGSNELLQDFVGNYYLVVLFHKKRILY